MSSNKNFNNVNTNINSFTNIGDNIYYTGSVAIGKSSNPSCALDVNGVISNGSFGLNTGAITSSGAITTSGAISSTNLSSTNLSFTNGSYLSAGINTVLYAGTGSIQLYSGAIKVATLSSTTFTSHLPINVPAITSSGALTNGANTVACGAITSYGAFTNGIKNDLLTFPDLINNVRALPVAFCVRRERQLLQDAPEPLTYIFVSDLLPIHPTCRICKC